MISKTVETLYGEICVYCGSRAKNTQVKFLDKVGYQHYCTCGGAVLEREIKEKSHLLKQIEKEGRELIKEKLFEHEVEKLRENIILKINKRVLKLTF